MKYLLDTCVISEIVKQRPDPQVVEWLKRQDPDSLFLPVERNVSLEWGRICGEAERIGRKRPAVDAARIGRWQHWQLATLAIGNI